jgi:hypothetical protein
VLNEEELFLLAIKAGGYLGSDFNVGVKQTLFLEGPNSLRANLERDFFAVYDNGLGLQVWLPNFFGVALAKTDIAAELFAFAGEFTLIHRI